MGEFSNELSGRVDGTVVQVGSAEQVHLARPVPTALSGLPPAPPEFTGRRGAREQLAAALHPEAETAGTVSTLTGTAGVGKTALAVRAAHDALDAGWFPGGVLFANLQGYDGNRYVSPDTAVTGFLGALGVPDEHFPATPDGRLALYRTRLAELAAADRAVLVLLDNASATSQAHPLLPPSPLHRALVTSRHTLADLPGARLVDLAALTVEEARALLVRTLRIRRPEDTRASEEAEAVDELVALCGRLPLALAVATALLSAEPELGVRELTSTLREGAGPLRELTYNGTDHLHAAFALSYARLTPEEARLFRLLTLDAGEQTSLQAAAALADRPTAETRRLLAGLRGAHMVEPGEPRGRVRFHDLLRLFAEERCAAQETREAQEAAVERLLGCYAAAAHEATERIVAAARGGRRDEEVEEWLGVERANLRSAVELAATWGKLDVALALANDVGWFLRRQQDWPVGQSTCEAAVGFARALGDPAKLADALFRLGDFRKRMPYQSAAQEALEEALGLYRQLDDTDGQARSRHSLGTLARRAGRLDEAEVHYTEALALFRALGDERSTGFALHNLGDTARRRADRLGETERHDSEELDLRRPQDELGDTAHGRDARRLARERYEAALAILDRVEETVARARTRQHLGQLARDEGEVETARTYWEAARRGYLEAWLPHYADEVGELLDGLP